MGPRIHRFPRELTKFVPLRVGAGRRRDIALHQRIQLRSPCIAATTPHVGCDQPAAPRRSQRTCYILTAGDGSGELFTGSQTRSCSYNDAMQGRRRAQAAADRRAPGMARAEQHMDVRATRSGVRACPSRTVFDGDPATTPINTSASRRAPRRPIAQRPDQGAAADTGCSGRSRARNGARRAAHGRASDAPTTFGRLLVNRARGRKRCPSVQLRAEFPHRLFQRSEAEKDMPR